KVDRRALPAWENAQPTVPPTKASPPTNALEAALVQMWEALLPGVRITVTDNFFDLGGTSLLAVRLQHRLEDYLGRRVPIVTLFQNPTIQGLARILRTEGAQPSRMSAAISDRAAKQRQMMARRRPVAGAHS
ncbi:MAG TPA: acyl carrier protein, partial [Verrucomicrobiota bacterium]|nr:acyl carrier protein [Verrucomicrobiota bacterium]